MSTELLTVSCYLKPLTIGSERSLPNSVDHLLKSPLSFIQIKGTDYETLNKVQYHSDNKEVCIAHHPEVHGIITDPEPCPISCKTYAVFKEFFIDSAGDLTNFENSYAILNHSTTGKTICAGSYFLLKENKIGGQLSSLLKNCHDIEIWHVEANNSSVNWESVKEQFDKASGLYFVYFTSKKWSKKALFASMRPYNRIYENNSSSPFPHELIRLTEIETPHCDLLKLRIELIAKRRCLCTTCSEKIKILCNTCLSFLTRIFQLIKRVFNFS